MTAFRFFDNSFTKIRIRGMKTGSSLEARAAVWIEKAGVKFRVDSPQALEKAQD
jgi:hypothetical protein